MRNFPLHITQDHPRMVVLPKLNVKLFVASHNDDETLTPPRKFSVYATERDDASLQFAKAYCRISQGIGYIFFSNFVLLLHGIEFVVTFHPFLCASSNLLLNVVFILFKNCPLFYRFPVAISKVASR